MEACVLKAAVGGPLNRLAWELGCGYSTCRLQCSSFLVMT